MKKIYIIIVLLITGMMAEAQTSVWNGSRRLWTNGEGTENSPFLIESAEQLAFLSYIVNKGIDTKGVYFTLTTDIDLNGSEDQPWYPIGMGNRWFDDDGCERVVDPSYQPFNNFNGHFDGGGHSIYNLYVDRMDYAGLFGRVSSWNQEGCHIENVFIESGFVKGTYSGGIVGDCQGEVIIANCWNNARIEGTEAAGGIVGKGSKSIHNCNNSGRIIGTEVAGGIVGLQPKEVTECFNTGNVSVDGAAAGGIIGSRASGKIVISNCYNTGDITGIATNGIGGIAGAIASPISEVTNCYNVGSVSNNGGNVGGLFGNNFAGGRNVYYLNTCGGWGPGTNKTAEEMRDPAFVGMLNLDTDVWGFDDDNTNDGYPVLTGAVMSTEESMATLMDVYPNPAEGTFTIVGMGWLNVINMLGQKVMECSVEGPTRITLPAGVYLLRLSDGKTATTAKVVVY